MKVDKETVVKHHFWILLGVLAPLVLVALCVLWFGAAGDIKKKEEDLDKMKKTLSSLNKSDVKNTHWVNLLGEKEKKVESQKDKVWKEVWQAQAGLMTWPQALVNDYEWLSRLYFLDDFYAPEEKDTTSQIRTSAKFRERFILDASGYQSQLEPLWKIVEPVGPDGKGVVQYLGGWQSIITHVDKWPQSPLPTPEEIWLAQEDLWVQHELLNVIKASNTFVSVYKKEPNPPKPDMSKKEIDRQVFTNPYWKLDLTLTNDQLKWEITNTGKQIQPLGLRYLIKLPGSQQREEILVDGEPLPPHHSAKGEGKAIKVGLGKTGLEAVTQRLDWRTAPVKRIDRLAMAYHSQRTSTKGLQPPPAKPGEGSDAAAATENPSGGGDGDMSSMMQGAMGKRMMMMGGAGGTGQSAELVNKTRYMDFGPQVRRMAVGMVLIVDQAHIQDVLAAFANSRMRVQITQVHWQHYAGSIKPVVTEGATGPLAGNQQVPSGGDGDIRPRGGMGAMGAMGGMGGKFRAGMPGMPAMPAMQMPGQAFPGGGGMTYGSASDEPTNLVELAVYGIASLYQRFPAKEAVQAEATATASN